jgi:Type II secretion system (T2SS), protein E, N-terminal domain
MNGQAVRRSPGEPRHNLPRLGELLLQKGYVTQAQLTDALQEAYFTRERLGAILVRKRFIYETDLSRTLAERLAVPYVSIRQVGFDRTAAELLPPNVGMAAIAIPIRVKSDTSVQVAFGDPTDPEALLMVSERVPRISVAITEVSSITDAWQSIVGKSGRLGWSSIAATTRS